MFILVVGFLPQDKQVSESSTLTNKPKSIFPEMDSDEVLRNLLTEETTTSRPEGILPPPTNDKGDVNGDSTINIKDLDLLRNVLSRGDMNKDGKIDDTDFKLLNEAIIRELFSPPPLDQLQNTKPEYPEDRKQGDINADGKVDYTDYFVMYRAMKNGDMDGNKKLDATDVRLLGQKIGVCPPPPPPQPTEIEVVDGGVDYIAGTSMTLKIGGVVYKTGYSAVDGINIDSLKAEDGSVAPDNIKNLVKAHEQQIIEIAGALSYGEPVDSRIIPLPIEDPEEPVNPKEPSIHPLPPIHP